MTEVDRVHAGVRRRAGALLEISSLCVTFGHRDAVLRGVDLSVEAGDLVGLVGESGSGKSMTALAILGLHPPQAAVSGRISFDGHDLIGLTPEAMRSWRGRQIAMIFQEPMTALDPVFRVGFQLQEAVRIHRRMSRAAARRRAREHLEAVGIPDVDRCARSYPFQLSGGMQQRVMIAMALICEPRLLLADEPTTALDVTIQAQVLALLRRLNEETGTAIVLITHDLAVVAETCHRVVTMYAGQVVEEADIDAILERPLHPYTSALIQSIPRSRGRDESLPTIPGRVPPPESLEQGCLFAPRCGHRRPSCDERPQSLTRLAGNRAVRCERHGDLVLPGAL